MRNMRSIGIDLGPYMKNGSLIIHADRPTSYGLEMHLVTMHKMVNDLKPDVVVLDPIKQPDVHRRGTGSTLDARQDDRLPEDELCYNGPDRPKARRQSQEELDDIVARRHLDNARELSRPTARATVSSDW